MIEVLEQTIYPAGQGTEPITVNNYIPTAEDYMYMSRAIYLGSLALGKNSPVGTVLVHRRSGQTWEAANNEFSEDDMRGHPEQIVYDQAQPTLGRDLSECAMYTTAEPCYGCTYFVDKGNLGELYLAAKRSDVPFFRRKQTEMHAILQDSRRSFVVISGLMQIQAKDLLQPEYNIHHKVDVAA